MNAEGFYILRLHLLHLLFTDLWSCFISCQIIRDHWIKNVSNSQFANLFICVGRTTFIKIFYAYTELKTVKTLLADNRETITKAWNLKESVIKNVRQAANLQLATLRFREKDQLAVTFQEKAITKRLQFVKYLEVVRKTMFVFER